MKLTVLGKYGPFPNAGGGTSSYLLRTRGANILLDAGEGSFSKVVGKIPPEKIDAFVITHFHFDHVCDLGVYSYYFERLSAVGNITEKPLLFCPADDNNPISAPFRLSPQFEVVNVKDGFEMTVKGVKLKFFAMRHPALCFGVKICDGERTFSYTGDTNVCENLAPLTENADCVLADGCFLFKDWTENKPHLSVKHCADLSLSCGAKVIVSHINPSYEKREILAEIPSDANCVVAEEGKEYEI
ncbi:MAG TPA: hypothetical protein DDW54_04420 [Clostridiales bacterium]|nr:hypothetical protein [Clostridiales bacterium]